MHSTAIDRRTLLAAFASAPFVSLAALKARAGTDGEPLYISARADDHGHFVTGLDADGHVAFDLPLPARGHSSAFHPHRPEAVHFARRPGTFARVIDFRSGKFKTFMEARPDRHFYGHGVYSPDGDLLYATENDFGNGTGVIGIYSVEQGYRRVGELPSHGIGPHDVRILRDGNTMVIANGGILTRPDLPRMKLNIPTMQPSLAYIDRRDGKLLEMAKLPAELHRLSIRHMDVTSDDLVAFAMQDEGPAGMFSPLVGTHRRGSSITLFDAREETLRKMKQYCGSVSFDAAGELLAVTSPRGNVVTFWEAGSGKFLHSLAVADGCGVAPKARSGRFVASSGAGGLFAISSTGSTTRLTADGALEPTHWDNHLVTAI